MMVAKNNSVSLSQSDAVEAVKPILSLDPFSDVMLSLKQLREAGYKLVSFTNSPERASQIQIKNAGISDLFDANISVQAIGKFKPHKDVYHWASKKMNVDDSDCMLIAAHGWDIAGALWAGWRGAFVARAGKQLFPLSLAPEINEPSLSGIVARLIRMKA
jgi:2-haloacid dehalogenase